MCGVDSGAIVWKIGGGLLVEVERAAPVSQALVGATQIKKGEDTRIVARGGQRLLEPSDGIFDALQFQQIGADVVVRIAKAGIDLDSEFTCCDRFIVEAQVRIRPAQKGVCLGSRVEAD